LSVKVILSQPLSKSIPMSRHANNTPASNPDGIESFGCWMEVNPSRDFSNISIPKSNPGSDGSLRRSNPRTVAGLPCVRSVKSNSIAFLGQAFWASACAVSLPLYDLSGAKKSLFQVFKQFHKLGNADSRRADSFAFKLNRKKHAFFLS